MPVIAGTHAFSAIVELYKYSPFDTPEIDFFRIYDSREAAEAGVVSWIINRWRKKERLDLPPWFANEAELDAKDGTQKLELEKIYLADHSDSDIIEIFFHNESPHGLDIESHIIEPSNKSRDCFLTLSRFADILIFWN